MPSHRADPTRTSVEPSRIAGSKSLLIPMESSLNDNGSGEFVAKQIYFGLHQALAFAGPMVFGILAEVALAAGSGHLLAEPRL